MGDQDAMYNSLRYVPANVHEKQTHLKNRLTNSLDRQGGARFEPEKDRDNLADKFPRLESQSNISR